MGRTPKGKTRNRIYQYVRRRILSGLPPTVREVQQAFGFSAVQTARQHLEMLVSEGRLVKEHGGKSRGYRLPPGKSARLPLMLVPLLGRVQAGQLDTATEDWEGQVAVQSQLDRKDLFALRVRGESMTGAGIFPGDIVIVRKQSVARSGDIVVALVEDEATVKRLRVRGGRMELTPENPAFEWTAPDPETVQILGKVVEVRRYLEGMPSWETDE